MKIYIIKQTDRLMAHETYVGALYSLDIANSLAINLNNSHKRFHYKVLGTTPERVEALRHRHKISVLLKMSDFISFNERMAKVL